jgi:hypothetical protein
MHTSRFSPAALNAMAWHQRARHLLAVDLHLMTQLVQLPWIHRLADVCDVSYQLLAGRSVR